MKEISTPRNAPAGQPTRQVARIWHGRVPAARASEYEKYLARTGFADYRATDGNRGVLALRRDEGGETHFLLITLWDSLESIAEFAGADIEAARYYPEDKDFLLEFEPKVKHYEVVTTGNGE